MRRKFKLTHFLSFLFRVFRVVNALVAINELFYVGPGYHLDE